MKPNILLIPDVPNWAFDNCAKVIMKYLSYKYNFTKIYNFEKKSKEVTALDHSPYDLVFRFISLPMKITENVPKQKLITSIRGQGVLENNFVCYTSKMLLNLYNCISVVATCFRDLLPVHSCPIFDTQNGVNSKMFAPETSKYPFTIGFAGNSKHPSEKGVDLLIKAANIAQVKYKVADRNVTWIPHDKMPSFYKDIDVYCCMSKMEGMPNTVLEAASCGKPVISTRVGGVPEVITHGKHGFLIDRSAEVLAESILCLKNDKDLYNHMSTETRKNIVENWDWEIMIKKYEVFFDFALFGKVENVV